MVVRVKSLEVNGYKGKVLVQQWQFHLQEILLLTSKTTVVPKCLWKSSCGSRIGRKTEAIMPLGLITN